VWVSVYECTRVDFTIAGTYTGTASAAGDEATAGQAANSACLSGCTDSKAACLHANSYWDCSGQYAVTAASLEPTLSASLQHLGEANAAEAECDAEVDRFLALAGEHLAANIECVPGAYAIFALGQAADGSYCARISPSQGVGTYDVADFDALKSSLFQGGFSPVTAGWISYAKWGRITDPTSEEWQLQITDDDYCFQYQATPYGERVGAGTQAHVNGFLAQVNARRVAAGRPAVSIRSGGVSPNYPADCGEPLGVSLQPMQTAYWNNDCAESYYGFGPRAGALRQRESYEIEVEASTQRFEWTTTLVNPSPNSAHPLPVVHLAGQNLGLFVFPDGTRLPISLTGKFVLGADGRLFLYDGVEPSPVQGQEDFKHSQFLGGGAVAAAGTLTVRDGKVTRFDNESGHYLPPCSALLNLLDVLANAGVDVSGCALGPTSNGPVCEYQCSP